MTQPVSTPVYEEGEGEKDFPERQAWENLFLLREINSAHVNILIKPKAKTGAAPFTSMWNDIVPCEFFYST